MPEEDKCLEAVHHVVHDYANLVSSGIMAISGHHLGLTFQSPVNTHISHAFLVNCRKMYEFFIYKPPCADPYDDIRAAHFLACSVTFDLPSWGAWHSAMNKQLMHVTFARVEKPKRWEGYNENKLFLDEFMKAWKKFLFNLDERYKTKFESEIAKKLEGEFRGLDLR